MQKAEHLVDEFLKLKKTQKTAPQGKGARSTANGKVGAGGAAGNKALASNGNDTKALPAPRK